MRDPHRILGLGAALALGACAGLELPRLPGTGPACPAADHQDWVGQRVDVLNTVDLPQGTRVLFPSTPATMDENPARLNVAVDRSDTITRVYCG